MNLRVLVLATLIPLGCADTHSGSGPAAAKEEAAPAREAAMETFQATLRVHSGDSPSVWLQPQTGPPLLLAGGAPSCFTPFDGLRVAVTGTRVRDGKISRFDLATLALADHAARSRAALDAVGIEQRLTGTVRERTGEPGSKMAGETWDVFETSATSWQIWGAPAGLPHDTPITVDARAVQVSPFAAHMPGPTLWIRSFTPAG